MKVSNITKTDDIISFNVSGIDTRLVNALRRIIISEVPVMAIEKITFYDNTSILNDEILAHRLGLIPLKTDLKTYNLPSDCTCHGKGCGKCTTTLKLEIEGPKTVYASDLKSKDKDVVPVYGKTPIAKLTKGQRIKLEATAQLGTGAEHTKWQGGLAAYEEKKDGSYDFTIESYGQLTPNELLNAAFDVFEKQIKELKKAIK